jgi:succinyl-diaminopimelate desuccinylase
MDARAQPTLALASELIARRSLTPDDSGCQALIAARLAPLGFRAERVESNGVVNSWLRRGDAAPLVCFAGHTDVVPTGPRDDWQSDPFVPTLRDGFLYGRGAADMKSSLAAFVTSIEAFVAARPAHAGSIALLLTSDEEGPTNTDGTVKVVELLASRGERIDYCIVGEPSSSQHLGDTIKIGRRGTLTGRLRVRGVQGHVAYPEQVRNPIHLAAPAIAELAGMQWDRGNEHFPSTSFQCSNIHAGTGAANVVPGVLELVFNWRYSTESTRESLVTRLEEVLRRHGLDYELALTASGKPFLTRPGRLVEAMAATIVAETGAQATLSTSGGTSDGRFIADICAELVEVGPVNATIHKLNERVAVGDLEPLARIYRGVLERLLPPSSPTLPALHRCPSAGEGSTTFPLSRGERGKG